MDRQLYSARGDHLQILQNQTEFNFDMPQIFVARTLMLHSFLMILRSLYQSTQVVLQVSEYRGFFWTPKHDKYFIFFLRRHRNLLFRLFTQVSTKYLRMKLLMNSIIRLIYDRIKDSFVLHPKLCQTIDLPIRNETTAKIDYQ